MAVPSCLPPPSPQPHMHEVQYEHHGSRGWADPNQKRRWHDSGYSSLQPGQQPVRPSVGPKPHLGSFGGQVQGLGDQVLCQLVPNGRRLFTGFSAHSDHLTQRVCGSRPLPGRLLLLRRLLTLLHRTNTRLSQPAVFCLQAGSKTFGKQIPLGREFQKLYSSNGHSRLERKLSSDGHEEIRVCL